MMENPDPYPVGIFARNAGVGAVSRLGLLSTRLPKPLFRACIPPLFALVFCGPLVPEVDAVAPQLVHLLLVDARARPRLAILRRPRLGRDAIQRQVGGGLGRRADGQHFLEDAANRRRLGFVDGQKALSTILRIILCKNILRFQLSKNRIRV